MIRINLLGQVRPRARRPAVPAGVALPISLLVLTLLASGGFVGWELLAVNKQIQKEDQNIARLNDEKKRLEQVKLEVVALGRQRDELEHQRAIIQELDRNRTGGQELLDAIANTVTKTDALWLTSLTRKGNSLSIEGTGGSMNAVANFITQLKRSGYFDNVEIKEAHQDDRRPTVPAFLFSLTADFALPQAKKAAPAAGGNS